MALDYKIEYLYDDTVTSDDSAFIHLKEDVPAYQQHISKENYFDLPEEQQHEFITGLFGVDGVTEISSQAFRVWVMKAPAFNWEEVLEDVLDYLKTELDETELNQLPGSAHLDGTGFRLTKARNRREI
jgi:hypothetical protein